MDPSEYLPEVTRILRDDFGCAAADIQPSANLLTDLGLDSLDHVEMVMCFEAEYGIDIPDDDAEKIKTVQDLLNYLAEHDDK